MSCERDYIVVPLPKPFLMLLHNIGEALVDGLKWYFVTEKKSLTSVMYNLGYIS